MPSSSIIPTQPVPDSSCRAGAIAPAAHTAVVLLALLGFSLVSAVTGSIGGLHSRVAQYASVIALEWPLVAFIAHGARRREVSMAELIGGRWTRPIEVLRDLCIAIGFLVVALAFLNGLSFLLRAGTSKAVHNLFPENPAEAILFLAFAVTAGFCEEIIFRGYLQRQFTALTRFAAGGIVLQGIVFGICHGYQGWKLALVISVYGTLFGLLAHGRRSLRPGMIAHFVQDGIGGFVARFLR